MVLANQSDDSLSLINSFSTIELCDKILTNDHPEWSRKSRVSSRIALDYSSPASWDAEKLKIGDEDVALHWNIGRLQGLADVLKHKGREVKETINGTPVTLKRPKGKLIGLNETRLESVTPMDETNVNDDLQLQVCLYISSPRAYFGIFRNFHLIIIGTLVFTLCGLTIVYKLGTVECNKLVYGSLH